MTEPELPLVVALDLIDSEIRRLTKILRRWPTGAFADKCRADRDHQLELRFTYQQRGET